MKIVLQRVLSASVEVDNKIVGSIDRGYLVYLGIENSDDKKAVEKMVDRLVKLRIFTDANGKTNLAAGDVCGEILVVSQFTLLADCSQNRPSFSRVGNAELAKELYEHFLAYSVGKFARVEGGRFAAHMIVNSAVDGPFTLVLEG